MIEKEIEVEEKEVENVYCDECGSKCTDDHKFERKEVCTSCADGSAVSRLSDLKLENDSNTPMTALEMVFLITIFPVCLLIFFSLVPADKNNADKHTLRIMEVFTIGTALWSAIITMMIVLS